jgi:general secretion pathway protein G
MVRPYNSNGIRAGCELGFTLLELLTVLAIIGVLAGIVLGVGRLAGERGRISRAKAELASLSAALEDYKRINGDYPQVAPDNSAEGETAGRALYAALNGQRGPAIAAAPFAQRRKPLIEHTRFQLAAPTAPETDPNHLLDPWGRAYRYFYDPGGSWRAVGFVLFSVGPDGEAALPFPGDGVVSPAFESASLNGRAVNADNLYAHRN